MAELVLIEDDAAAADALSARLQGEGHRVQVVSKARARALGLTESDGTQRDLETIARAAYEDAERRAIVDALARFRGNRTRAAADLGVSRSTLWQKLRRYGLSESAPPPAPTASIESPPPSG